MGDIADDIIQDGLDDLAQGGWCEDCRKWVSRHDLEWGRCCKERERQAKSRKHKKARRDE